MGCPLFSHRYDSPAVAVRVEPDGTPVSEQPVCERWTYWKPFDPDSEEFFVNEVYEAFVDPVANIERDREPSPVVEESSSSSEDESTSGRGTPIADPIPDRREMQQVEDESIGIRLHEDRVEAVVIRRVNEESEERLRRELNNQGGTRNIVPIHITVNRNNRAHPPTPSTPPPSTPPSLSTPLFQVTPSPVLDTTPRLYSWRELASPTRGSLATARRALPGVSVPRMHDVAV